MAPARKGPRLGRRAGVLSAFAIASIAALLGPGLFVERSAAPFVFATAGEVPARPVAIVPGARVDGRGRPTPILEDRLRCALDLYRAGRVERILASGDHGTPGYDEPNAMGRWLVRRGVRSADVYLDHAGVRTLDTMERAARVFEVRAAVVCTQRFHVHRAVFLARRAGIDAVGLLADRWEYRAARRDRAREVVARTVALLDSYVLGREPRHLGPPIPIGRADARLTHDRSTLP